MSLSEGITTGINATTGAGLNWAPGASVNPYPHNATEWAELYPDITAPDFGWVFDTGSLPLVDGFGGITLVDNGNGANYQFATFKGRGGGTCLEMTATDTSGLVSQELDFDNFGTDDCTVLLSFWRQEDESVGNENFNLISKRDGLDQGWWFLERADSLDVLGMGFEDQDTTSHSLSLVLTTIADPTYATSWDMAMVRSGEDLDIWAFENGSTEAIHDNENPLDVADVPSTSSAAMTVFSGPMGSNNTRAGTQVKAVYIWRGTALTRNQLDTYRGTTTATQTEK